MVLLEIGIGREGEWKENIECYIYISKDLKSYVDYCRKVWILKYCWKDENLYIIFRN